MSKVSRLDDCRRDLDASLDDFDRAVGPKELLAAARAVRACTEALEQAAVLQARADGASWAKIGAAYGLTKQGAQQRFRERAAAADDKAIEAPGSPDIPTSTPSEDGRE
ncbi:hypothetical protein GA0111570_101193 [Raineyella antarctica]|uniref:Uncharacterized protein n=1 Tax=Raineyella antarctica TaxID=1577474 RepID=A0A1G6GD78_9ACTN|nr:hypothetical protein [Raineyella antarctica]SDB79920.1 hypothetical protein GA0111570_101193 [Raineyella antarctica]